LGTGLRISAVIPVYNETEVIDEFSSRLVSALEKIDPDYEAIFVVEGTDSTLEKLTALSKENPRIKVHYSQERLGLGKAMKKGFGLIDEDTEYIVTMDADLNHQPEEIQKLMAAAKNVDIVVGSRNTNNGMVEELPLVKRMISATTNWTMRKIFHIPSNDVTSGFRIYTCKAVETLRDQIVAKNFEIQPELLIRARKKGMPIADVPITFLPRPRGTSKLSFVKSGIGYAMLIIRLGL
jgi:dolichol-phosphate mannosyltransferase